MGGRRELVAVTDDEVGAATLGAAVDQFDELVDLGWVEPLSRFVHDHHRRALEVDGGVDQTLSLTA